MPIDRKPTNSQAIADHCHAVRGTEGRRLAWIPEDVMADRHRMAELRAVLLRYTDTMTCIHQGPGLTGLCGECQDEWDTDPDAWLEYGNHTQGLERWRQLQEEIAAEAAKPRTPLPEDV